VTKKIAVLAGAVLALAAGPVRAAETTAPRPPAVPLVTHDPYFSIWSMSDTLAGDETRHWTGAPQPLRGLVRVDGRTFRFLGAEPRATPVLTQTRLTVTPTRSLYEFEGAGIRMAVVFLSPLFPSDLDLLARPVTYLTIAVGSADEKPHAVELYVEASAHLAVNSPTQKVAPRSETVPGLAVLGYGTVEQPVLKKKGDNVRIDWGYAYLAAPSRDVAARAFVDGVLARQSFSASGASAVAGAAANPGDAVAFGLSLGSVTDLPVARHLLLAYDDLMSIEHFGKPLRPYWRRGGTEAAGLLAAAEGDYASISERAVRFDEELTADLRRVGGPSLARLGALAFRQAMAAHKLASREDGGLVFFPKENFSNGCINTVDVFYPSSPLFLLLNPRLLEAQVVPMLEYAAKPRWKFPFAPHDLGTYPLANGQVYGGGEESERDQMPVEESGNMLILVSALAEATGSAEFARPHLPVLNRWAEYLKGFGLDPAEQLSTDDFAGHLAHNTNLSLKATLALGAHASLLRKLGLESEARVLRETADAMAAEWVKKADDGDHFRLAFDRPGTWSQKYNLVWDRILGLHLFPDEVAAKEAAFYKGRLQPMGLPLDSRKSYTKLDWTVWSATLAASADDRRAFYDALDRFVNESPARVPLTDWYDATTGKQEGFQARSVVGGVFLPLLYDERTWEKWRLRAR
jgi:hypothetical protein